MVPPIDIMLIPSVPISLLFFTFFVLPYLFINSFQLFSTNFGSAGRSVTKAFLAPKNITFLSSKISNSVLTASKLLTSLLVFFTSFSTSSVLSIKRTSSWAIRFEVIKKAKIPTISKFLIFMITSFYYIRLTHSNTWCHVEKRSLNLNLRFFWLWSCLFDEN